MLISEKDQKQFSDWVIPFFKTHRKTTSAELYDAYRAQYPTAAKRIAKAGKNIGGGPAYISRYLLSGFKREGWLVPKESTWNVKTGLIRCFNCLKPVDDIYMVGKKGGRCYCSYECFDATEDESDVADSYWDNYMEMFEEVKSYTSQFRILSESGGYDEPMRHIRICELIESVVKFKDSLDTLSIIGYRNDGPFARETFRLYTLLEKLHDNIVNFEEKIRSGRQKQTILYTITIDYDYLFGAGKKNKTLQNFIKKSASYQTKLGNEWATEDLNLRNDWWKKLDNSVGLSLHYGTFTTCPMCGSDVRSEGQRAIDGYTYCYDCYELI